jgi:hypothetical protein
MNGPMMKNLTRATLLGVALAATIGAACAHEGSDQASTELPAATANPPQPAAAATEPTAAAAMPSPESAAAAGDAQIRKLPNLSTHGGPPSTKVTVSIGDMLIGDSLEIGFGSFVEHQILGGGKVGRDGAFKGTFTVPADATMGSHFVFVAQAAGSPIAISDPFIVTRADGTFTLRGQISDVKGQCKIMKGTYDETYALAGKIGSPALGAHVTVQGKLAASSPCTQPVVVDVATVKVEP